MHILCNAERGGGEVSSSVIIAFFTNISQSEFLPNLLHRGAGGQKLPIFALTLRNMCTAPYPAPPGNKRPLPKGPFINYGMGVGRQIRGGTEIFTGSCRAWSKGRSHLDRALIIPNFGGQKHFCGKLSDFQSVL